MSGTTNIVSSTPGLVAGTYGGQLARHSAHGNVLPGLFLPGDLAVSERAAGANESVDIAAGSVYMHPQDDSQQGVYIGTLLAADAPYNTSTDGGYSWTAADGSNPRIDILYAIAADASHSGSYTGWRFGVADGTPNAGATGPGLTTYWPSIPSGAVPIAAVHRPTSTSDIEDADILNLNRMGGPRVSADVGVQAFTATGTIDPALGRLVTFAGAASQTLTLPAAYVGLQLEVWNIDASNGVAVSRAGSDTIVDNLTTGATTFNIPAGARATFTCVAAGVWVADYTTPVSKVGTFTSDGGTPQAVTGVGFRPKIVEFFYMAPANTANLAMNTGAMHANGNQHVFIGAADGAGGSRNSATDGCIGVSTSAASSSFFNKGAFSSMDPDGFSVTWSAHGSALTFGYRARA